MADLRDRRLRLPHIPVTRAVLKWYGCLALLCYTLSMSVLQNGLLQVNVYSNDQLRQMWAADGDLMALSSWAAVLQLLGGLAVPVLAFLLVEGFLHTGSYPKYLLRMGLFALLSEIPYDFAMTGQWVNWQSQNLLFSLFLGLVMLYGLKLFSAGKGACVAIVLAAVLWSALMGTQFGLCLLLLVAVFYLFRNKSWRFWLAGAISLMYITGPLSLPVIKRYQGQAGKLPNKYLFYILYPAHLVLLGAVTGWLM